MISDIAALYDIFRHYPRISTDSRRVVEGSLFFALHGDNFDGNLFAAAALESGAARVIVDDPAVVKSDRYILVEDTLATLQQLAAYHRETLAIPVLAITGSNGKTTTKELIARVLSRKFKISVTKGNLNNHIGVPLTILDIDSSHEFAIVEMGASACGEIALLCDIAAPNFGIITNIGRAHLEGFINEQGVRKGKGELFDYLRSYDGLALFLSDDPVLSGMINERANLRSIAYSVASAEAVKHRLVGDYNRYNVAAAVAIGRHFGVDNQQIAEAVWSYVPDNNRSQRVSSSYNELIVDCYNANPSSMGAALSNFSTEKADIEGVTNDKIVILGDMLELGDYSTAEHLNILSQLESMGITAAYVVGESFCRVADGFAPETYRLQAFPNRESLQKTLAQHPLRNKFILIKGSRGVGLERLIEDL